MTNVTASASLNRRVASILATQLSPGQVAVRVLDNGRGDDPKAFYLGTSNGTVRLANARHPELAGTFIPRYGRNSNTRVRVLTYGEFVKLSA